MPGLSPKLPLSIDAEDGYALNKDYVSLVKQNLKMLILTSPGERVMMPEFGVGIRSYLFEPLTDLTKGDIDSKIRDQVARYLSYLQIDFISFSDIDAEMALPNAIKITLSYSITPLEMMDSLTLDVSI
tara:strand:- start:494 stop:877 length:384 start_codon:yes stop_codon:yes gene_type:complete